MLLAFRLRGTEFATRLLSLTSISLATRTSVLFTNRRSLNCQQGMAFSTEEFGTCYTTNYMMYIKDESGTTISPFHDIPLLADKENGIYNMVVEIPRWTNAKMEISTKDKMNPIKQDMKKGKVRFVKNSFPYKGYIWNYGAIPQTWEDPSATDQHTGQIGDGDPIDVVDIGYKVSFRGEVKQVKVLGIMALIDEGETDWKVIAIDVKDPMAATLRDIKDVRKTMPGLLEATYEWFRTYKMPGGSPPNEFAFNGEVKNRAFATEIITETHEQWRKLVMNEIDKEKLACQNLSVEKSPYKIDKKEAEEATKDLPKLTAPDPLPGDVDMMYYLTQAQKDGTDKVS